MRKGVTQCDWTLRLSYAPYTMQFTPQQLSGGPKFTSAVKIGNWAEDRARAEVSDPSSPYLAYAR